MEDRVNHDEDSASIAENIESLFDSAKEYGKTRIDLIKLRAADKSAEIISSLAAGLVFLIIMIVCFAILSVGLALLLGLAVALPTRLDARDTAPRPDQPL